MKLLPCLPFDQVGDAPGRPQRGAISQSFRTFFESAAQLLQLPRQQARFAAGPTRFEQGFGSLFSPSLVPSANRLSVHPQFTGHLALTEPAVKQSGGLQSPPFQAGKISLHASWIAHVQIIAWGLRCVTILCKCQ